MGHVNLFQNTLGSINPFPPIQFHTYKRHTVMYVYVVYINFVPAEVPILSAPALIIASKSSLVLTPPLAFTFT